MDMFLKIFLTILSGVCVFIISQYILEFILKPLIEYRKVIAQIDNKLKLYANIITNPHRTDQLPENYKKAKDEFRKLSCDLESTYKILLLFKPKKEVISEAARDLIWISNAIGHIGKEVNPLEADKKIDNIRKLLKIPEL